ncbi:prohibitin family protein [uncultured Shewanella sp.]|uniref:prohibitin family protein n=1 Tax=uncultured Shewanella sp. TaxID=173975 RepID=UPI00262082C4|nr:prohibitin family protein [uncultured Shewanella sp.]
MIVEFSVLYVISVIILAIVVLFSFLYGVIAFYRKRRPEFVDYLKRLRINITLSLLTIGLLALIIVPVVLLPIPSGHMGVLWKRFDGGVQLDQVFPEGTVLVLPWDELTTYSTRFQVFEENVEAVSSEGLKMTLDVMVRYRPIRAKLPYLHKLVGQEYASRLVFPELASSSRQIVSQHPVEDTYSLKREQVQNEIFASIETGVHLNAMDLQNLVKMDGEAATDIIRFVELEDVLIKTVTLPAKTNEAITAKVNQQHLDQEYALRLEVAKKEAQRKEIEAEGIAAFQAKVIDGISETYLRWRGIEATLELAQSQNAKIVLIGGGKDSLPLILNTEDSTQTTLVPSSSNSQDIFGLIENSDD